MPSVFSHAAWLLLVVLKQAVCPENRPSRSLLPPHRLDTKNDSNVLFNREDGWSRHCGPTCYRNQICRDNQCRCSDEFDTYGDTVNDAGEVVPGCFKQVFKAFCDKHKAEPGVKCISDYYKVQCQPNISTLCRDICGEDGSAACADCVCEADLSDLPDPFNISAVSTAHCKCLNHEETGPPPQQSQPKDVRDMIGCFRECNKAGKGYCTSDYKSCECSNGYTQSKTDPIKCIDNSVIKECQTKCELRGVDALSGVDAANTDIPGAVTGKCVNNFEECQCPKGGSHPIPVDEKLHPISGLDKLTCSNVCAKVTDMTNSCPSPNKCQASVTATNNHYPACDCSNGFQHPLNGETLNLTRCSNLCAKASCPPNSKCQVITSEGTDTQKCPCNRDFVSTTKDNKCLPSPCAKLTGKLTARIPGCSSKVGTCADVAGESDVTAKCTCNPGFINPLIWNTTTTNTSNPGLINPLIWNTTTTNTSVCVPNCTEQEKTQCGETADKKFGTCFVSLSQKGDSRTPICQCMSGDDRIIKHPIDLHGMLITSACSLECDNAVKQRSECEQSTGECNVYNLKAQVVETNCTCYPEYMHPVDNNKKRMKANKLCEKKIHCNNTSPPPCTGKGYLSCENNTDLGYKCHCGAKYSNTDNDNHNNPQKCFRIDECTRGVDGKASRKPCQNSISTSTCKLLQDGGYECRCKSGFQLEMADKDCVKDECCKDINECAPQHSHKCSDICIDGLSPPGSYTCGCHAGLKLNSNKRDCESCEYGEWSDYGPCRGHCGRQGSRLRTRITINNDISTCTDPNNPGLKDEKTCHPPCGTCQYNTWSDWSECSSVCSGGKRHRSRTLIEGSNITTCKDTTETQDCNTSPCATASDLVHNVSVGTWVGVGIASSVVLALTGWILFRLRGANSASGHL